jgi:hypothetical protein
MQRCKTSRKKQCNKEELDVETANQGYCNSTNKKAVQDATLEKY